MSQRELAELIGFITGYQVSRHERSVVIPSLLAALSYEAVFCIPVADLFPGVFATIQRNVESRISELGNALHDVPAKGRQAQVNTRKQQWLCERLNRIAVEQTT
jgi:transposase